MRAGTSIAFATFLGMSALPAHADLTISTKPTASVACESGACSATAKRANLNVTELTDMLASSDVSLISGRKAANIVIKAPVSWSGAHRLALDAFHSIEVDAPIIVMGTAGMTITTNHQGFGSLLLTKGKGHIEFWDTNSSLTINGDAYTLAADLATLAADIHANPSSNYALAKSYDASADGTYTHAAIDEYFNGAFEGLGNTVSHFKIKVGNGNLLVGLFEITAGDVSNLHIDNVNIDVGRGITAGALTGYCARDVTNVDVSGKIKGAASSLLGGLCGKTSGTVAMSHSSVDIKASGRQGAAGSLIGSVLSGGRITNCYATGDVVSHGENWAVGGLVGESLATAMDTSFATGTVLTGDDGYAGGLAGVNDGPVTNSYATGFTSGGTGSTVGGLFGFSAGAVSDSYSSGAVASGSGNAVGGFIGEDNGDADLTDTYWDITTSGQSHGVGNDTAYPGITGLTTEQFQAGLPDGFDPSIWAEDPGINGGLPYLLPNPQAH